MTPMVWELCLDILEKTAEAEEKSGWRKAAPWIAAAAVPVAGAGIFALTRKKAPKIKSVTQQVSNKADEAYRARALNTSAQDVNEELGWLAKKRKSLAEDAAADKELIERMRNPRQWTDADTERSLAETHAKAREKAKAEFESKYPELVGSGLNPYRSKTAEAEEKRTARYYAARALPAAGMVSGALLGAVIGRKGGGALGKRLSRHARRTLASTAAERANLVETIGRAVGTAGGAAPGMAGGLAGGIALGKKLDPEYYGEERKKLKGGKFFGES